MFCNFQRESLVPSYFGIYNYNYGRDCAEIEILKYMILYSPDRNRIHNNILNEIKIYRESIHLETKLLNVLLEHHCSYQDGRCLVVWKQFLICP